MQSPTGSVVALSSASATVFSIGMVFLGYWGLHETGTWGPRDYFIVTLAMAGFACLGSVPWLATTPLKRADDEPGIRMARRMFVCGVSLMWCAVLTSLF